MNPYQGLKQNNHKTDRAQTGSNQHESLSGIETPRQHRSAQQERRRSNQHESLSGIETIAVLANSGALPKASSNQHESLSGIETRRACDSAQSLVF